jgi:hypothetical protein
MSWHLPSKHLVCMEDELKALEEMLRF